MRVQFRALGRQAPGVFAMEMEAPPLVGDFVHVPVDASRSDQGSVAGRVVGREFRFWYGRPLCIVVVDDSLAPEWGQ